MYKLLLKIHNKTGMKYLCMTEKADHVSYKGSGKHWKRHIKVHGYDVTTILLYCTTSADDFKDVGASVSEKLNIVERNDFANLRPETGEGGDTVSNKMWITDGETEMYILKTSPIPSGFRRGRSSRCVFNSKENQSMLSRRVDRKSKKYYESRKIATEKMMVTRDHTKCGKPGDLNPAKRQEVRDKIGASNSKPITINGIEYKSIKQATIDLNTTRHEISKLLRKESGNGRTH